MISLSDRAGALIVASLIKYSVGFVLPMVLVRMLSKDDYGTYQQLILIGTATGALALQLPTSVYYFYHHVPPANRSSLIVQTSLMLGMLGACGTAGLILFAAPIAETVSNQAVADLLPLFAFSVAFIVGSEHCIAFLITQNRFVLAVAVEIGETIVRVALLLLPLLLGYGLKGLVVGVVFHAALRYVVRTACLFKTPGMRFAGWSQSLIVQEQLRYSLPLALIGIALMLGNTFNRGIVAASFTAAEFAIYAVGALEIPLDVIFQGSVHNILRASLPPLVRDGNLAEVVRIICEAVRKLSIIVLPSFVFLFEYSSEFITVLFTSRYEQSVHIFQIYVLVVPLHMLVLSPIPQIFGKTEVSFYVNAVVIAVLVLLSYVLLNTVGFFGPAIAWVVAQYVGAILFFAVVCKLTRSTLARLLPIRALLRVVLASVVAVSASRIAADLSSSVLVNLVLSGAVFSVAFLALAAMIGVFEAEDRRLIRRWIAKVLPIRAE